MRLRTAQLACFVVLLSAFGVAAARNRDNCRDCASLHVLLAQVAAVNSAEAAPPPAKAGYAAHDLPAAARTWAEQPWSMRPPAAQSSQLRKVTGSGL